MVRSSDGAGVFRGTYWFASKMVVLDNIFVARGKSVAR